MSGRTAQVVGLVTAATLAGVGVLHVAWGRGSTFPFTSRERLNDTVIGRQVTPSSASCHAVATALGVAALSVGRAATGGGSLVRLASAGTSAVLVVRAGFGLAGRTDRLVPGSVSPGFRRADRRVLSPLCASLGAGAAIAATRRRPR